MAGFFKKQSQKDKPENPGQPPEKEGAGMAPPPPPKKKSGFFGKKGPHEPKPPKVKKEKKPKTPKVKKEKKPKTPKGPKQSRAREPRPPKAKKARTGGGFGGSKISPVGLDLGRSSITAARLRYQTGGSQLLQVAMDSFPEGLIHEGEVKDVEALAFAIKDFWKTHKIKGKKVSLGLANQKVVARTLEFPLIDEKELRSAIEFQAQDYIPIPIEEAVFDFLVLGRFTDEEGIEKQKVLVVAAQKDMVMDFINAVKRARLGIAGIDLQAFAMIRVLAPTSFLDQGPADEAVAIANIAADVTNLVVVVTGEPQFTRIIAFGGDDFTKAVQDLQGIPFIEAEELKARVGLAEPGTNVEGQKGGTGWLPEEKPPETGRGGEAPGAPQMPEEPSTSEEPSMSKETEETGWPAGPPIEAESEAETMANIRRTLELTADALAEELRRSLDYFMSQEQAVPIGRLVLSGGGAMLKNLEAHLSQIFPFPVEVGNPMLRVVQNKSDLTDEEIQVLAPRLTIAIGLALEDEG